MGSIQIVKQRNNFVNDVELYEKESAYNERKVSQP